MNNFKSLMLVSLAGAVSMLASPQAHSQSSTGTPAMKLPTTVTGYGGYSPRHRHYRNCGHNGHTGSTGGTTSTGGASTSGGMGTSGGTTSGGGSSGGSSGGTDVPAPGMLALFALGAAGIGLGRRRQRRALQEQEFVQA